MLLGLADDTAVKEFIRENPLARLGSLNTAGLRRVQTDATGIILENLKQSFMLIQSATVKTTDSLAILSAPEPIPCVHRGSQRRTCCGAPDMWICRELKTDCVADEAAAEKLQDMVATTEAAAVKVCSACNQRKAPAPRVGFLSTAYMAIGGTETFHRSLLPRLKSTVDIAGFVATGFHDGDGSKLQVPYATGIEAAKRLAAHCETLVVWGIHNLEQIMPANRPHVIAVHHADWSSQWNNNLVLSQLDLIDEVICVNPDTARQLADCGKPAHYIPNAIDPARITPSGNQSQLRQRFGIPDDSKIVLFGHRLSAEKRPVLAVEIARQLPSDWTMVIAGDGVERSAVEAAAAGCDRVRIVGAVESLADWLSVSDCFLSLSTFEGFGLAIGEAMAAGIPTVATPTGIAPGLATTLPTNSTAAEWAQAIAAAKVIAPAEFILEQFSVDRMVNAWARVINESIVAAGSGG